MTAKGFVYKVCDFGRSCNSVTNSLSGHQTGRSNRSTVVMILRVVVYLFDYIVLIGWIHSTFSMSHIFSDNRFNNVYFLMLQICGSKKLFYVEINLFSPEEEKHSLGSFMF